MNTLNRLRLWVVTFAAISLTLSSYAQDTNKTITLSQSLSLEVTVLLFKPAKAERLMRGFKDLKGDLASVVEGLKLDGSVSILYNATRDLRLEDKARAKFDSLETRPIVIIGKPSAPIPPATAYGLKLEITARPGSSNVFGLGWEGEVTWSPEIVERWQGERFLSFASSALGTLKQAGVIGGKDAKTGDMGLELAQLFNPKGKPTENEIYELPVNKTVSFNSSRNCRDGELIINATTSEMGNKEAQTILLLITPRVSP
jgi:hypothetical protein